ncbi:pentatricopeptide repeat-containing protein At1g31790 [Malania oleifera]|uniref:pentatricopeptide repeat-containing protein At1g31790 n=1 Tax=Malania oleifera TaxID=397392 RepID=UPI0025AE937C|nr:pentatricopeptide repeat-containing protein At1g31790 [Malania oleifera]
MIITNMCSTSTMHTVLPTRVPHINFKRTPSTPNASSEIRLLLQRPKRVEPIKPPISNRKKKNENFIAPTTTISSSIGSATATRGRSTTSDVLRLMDGLRLPIPPDMYASLIKECMDTRDAAGAAELHAHIVQSGVVPCLPLLNRLLLMHVGCGRSEAARQLFDQMSQRSSISWTIVIADSAHEGRFEEAIGLFQEMLQHHGNMLVIPPWILVCLLKACVHTVNVALGKQVHGWLLKAGYTRNLFLSTSLMNFYGKCRCLPSANFVFDHMNCHDTVVWTTSIVNNCREEHFEEVLNAFNDMGRAGVRKNGYTFSSVLKACGRMKDDGRCGRQVHADAIKHGVDFGSFVQCGLIDMYGKCGLVGDAERLFEMICDKKNTACWNAMLTAYIWNGFCIEALKFLYHMKAVGVQPQESLINEVRIACGSRSFEKKELME